ncbi:MAG: NUDIX domain-containing protein [Gammaproteobacteria bacterium]|nr:NUDIX domain-containing protein [Gammaproteobacteria bacterium]MBU1724816.1 NUDIX domain-containing protein [Gammaproteobacteria bacterium]MBU2006521.1 NUDIX domain-containing protein [Gammaproteobacteria bacterium]
MKFDISKRHLAWKGFFSIEQYEFRHELFGGGWSDTVRREIFERGNAVAVLLHDPVADTLLLVEQFRPGAAVRNPDDAWMIEIVAGIVEEGETREDVARRESMEEAGCTVGGLEHIMDFYPSAGGSSEIVSLYYAPVDLSAVQPGIRGLAHEHEDIRVSIVPRQTALEWLQAGRIQASLAIIALQWLALRRG